MRFNIAQEDSLSELFLDIAKAMYIAAFSLPFFITIESIFDFAKLFFLGTIYAILALMLKRNRKD